MSAAEWGIVKREIPANINRLDAWIGVLSQDRAVDQIVVIMWQMRELITRWASYNDQPFRNAATADGVDVSTVFPAISTRINNITNGVISYLTTNGQAVTRNGRLYIADKYFDADGTLHMDLVTAAESAPLVTALTNLRDDLQALQASLP